MKLLKCPKCGNMVLEVEKKPCNVMCCGVELEEVVAGSVDAAKEKHVPVVSVQGSTVKVVVGEVVHPMQEVHYITFIALETNKGVHMINLKPQEAPEATFVLPEGEEPKVVYEYCNLHGLWKKEL